MLLVYVAITIDIERTKLDTAGDFSASVQHLEATISQLETMATILSKSITHNVDYDDKSDKDILDYFEQQGDLFSLKFIDDNYRSHLYTKRPINNEQKSRLELLLKTGAYLPHFLQEEKIEEIAIHNNSPQAKLLYPHNNKMSKQNFESELDNEYWQLFWKVHQKKNIYWKLIKRGEELKLSLTVSILDPVQGLVGIIQLLFAHDAFDQDIYYPDSASALVLLTENSPPYLLVASTKASGEDLSDERTFKLQVGRELPSAILALQNSLKGWVYQSDKYFMLSVPLSSAFNFIYLTDSKEFGLMSSRLMPFGLALIASLIFLGIFVERLVHKSLTALKQKDDTLMGKNQLLSTTLTELEETYQELIHREKIASLGNVVAGLAHQLNTPLSIAITAASYITESNEEFIKKFDSGLKKSELKEFLQKGYESSLLVSNNLDKTTHLVDNFKLLSNDESADELNLFNVVEYTEAVIQGFKPRLDARRIKSKINSEQGIKIYNYPISFTQVIVQLVNNSMLHGVESGGSITINIYKGEAKTGVFVDIIDDGKGIKKEDIDRVFEPFFTSKCVAEQVGLGLTIVHNLILGKMSGEIKVSSERGEGCCFSLYIPSLT